MFSLLSPVVGVTTFITGILDWGVTASTTSLLLGLEMEDLGRGILLVVVLGILYTLLITHNFFIRSFSVLVTE